MKKLFLTLFSSIIALSSFGQIDAKMFRHPDVSKDQITFCYAGDIWVVSKNGGTAYKLSSPPGEEAFPKFSPDGQIIAFTGNYNGNADVYTIPITGGLPERKTWHGLSDRVVNWHPNGKQVLFASARESGKDRWNQFYLTGMESGLPEKLPLEHAEYGAYSEDGNTLFFTDKSRLTRNWKRYRGGTAPDIWMINLSTKEAKKIAKNDANNELPMVKGNKVYFLSDRGTHMRANLWVYDTQTEAIKQVTHYTDYDIHHPSIGPDDIVYEANGSLYLFNLETEKSTEVQVNLVSDQRALIPQTKSTSSNVSSYFISHDAKRVAVEARGELFSIPVEHGYTANLTQTSGVAERHPSWSPNGKYLAYWSDESGEYQLVLKNMEDYTTKTLTEFTEGYRYQMFWSPDSRKIAFIQQDLAIKVIDVNSGKISLVDSLHTGNHGRLNRFSVSWDSTSEWITYAADSETTNQVIAVYNIKKEEKTVLTSGFYSDFSPVFSTDGDYIYFLTNRHFSPQYSDFQGSWAYTNSTMLAAIPLTKDTPSPLEFRNDETVIQKKKEAKKQAEEKEDEKEKKPESKKKKGAIDFEGLEQRIVILPIKPGSYFQTEAVPGKILYLNKTDAGIALKYYDIKARKEQTIISGISNYQVAANDKKILALSGSRAGVINIAPSQSLKQTINLSEMQVVVNPKEEWLQIYRDAWRLERDFFYDRTMHGVDWEGVYDKYLPLLEQCATRWDVNFVLGEMLGELNASHAYKSGGDTERGSYTSMGYLGVNYSFEDDVFKIDHIVKGSPWEVKTKSPLSQPGVDINEGDYLLAVNGVPLDTQKSPFAAFEGLAGKSVELTVNDRPQMKGSRKVVVKTLSKEYTLRNLEWIEQKRARVEEATNGKVGYIYVPSTGVDGQTELVRQFMGQWTKPALIIDERWNNGGQIPDRFIELLNRKPFSFLAGRTGEDRQVPYVGHFGPKVMMINGWSGSGGDAFPDYFRKAELGELVGTRTWGGLIGVSGAPSLIDGGTVTVPTFRLYDPNGEWFREGHGVDPDIEVDENAGQLAKGIDPQLEEAIKVILRKLETEKYTRPVRAPYEVR